MLEKTLESPSDCKEIQPVHPKGNQSWIFIGKTDAEAETPILWPPDVKNWLIWKDPDAGKDWRQEEKGTTEHEMIGWHHWLDGHEFEWILGVGDGQGSLVCCSPWGHKESNTTKRLNRTEHNYLKMLLFLSSWGQFPGQHSQPKVNLFILTFTWNTWALGKERAGASTAIWSTTSILWITIQDRRPHKSYQGYFAHSETQKIKMSHKLCYFHGEGL